MSNRNVTPTPEEWRKLNAEWTHDYGLRRMEERGVKYEDQAARPLDHAADRGHPAAGPPHPWPSEIAKANRQKQPGQDQGKNHSSGHQNGHDNGHSM